MFNLKMPFWLLMLIAVAVGVAFGCLCAFPVSEPEVLVIFFR